ncbi:MAG: DegT/DnrJ/EryC1/StrS family aminotransferase [Thermoproteota archaeon]
MVIKTIPPVKPYFPFKDIQQIKDAVEKILKSGMLTLGDYVKKFEAEYAKICRVHHAIATSSGTSALEMALRAMKLKEGDEVLVPTNTFTATVASVIFAGGKPRLTDINPESLSIDAENVQKHLTQKTKGIIAVHIGGLICPEIKQIKEICEDHNLFLIEDAAHAHGSTINGDPAGSLGDIGCFSFYPTKVMTTSEGGMITTNKDDVAHIIKIMRDQGKESADSNIIIELGYNWRMNEISAAIGLAQLRRLNEIVAKRNQIAKLYEKGLSQLSGIRPQKIPPNMVTNFYKYIAFLKPEIDRDRFKQKLREQGVRCGGEVYWPPCHLQPIYQRLLGTKQGDFPISEEVTKRMICLPMFTQMTQEEVSYVLDKVRDVLQNI